MKKKIIIGVLIILFIVIGVIIAYKLIEKGVINKENFEFNVENISPTPVNTISNQNNNKSEVDEVMDNVTNTSYSYTKIGHIDNLPDLENGSIIVKMENL